MRTAHLALRSVVVIALLLIGAPASSQEDGSCRCFTFNGEGQAGNTAFDMSFDNKCGASVTFYYWRERGNSQDGHRQSAYVQPGSHTERCNGSRDFICTNIIKTLVDCSRAQSPSQEQTRQNSHKSEPRQQPSPAPVPAPVPGKATERPVAPKSSTPFGPMTESQHRTFITCGEETCLPTMNNETTGCIQLLKQHRNAESSSCALKSRARFDECMQICANKARDW